MCELLGMSFNVPVSPSFSFRGFKHRGSESKNADGWGLAYYPDDSKKRGYAAQILKEPVAAEKSVLLQILSSYPQVKSRLFIAHVRKRGSRGAVRSYRNTHPFQRELHGRDYVFAHHGTLNEHRGFREGRFKAVGETDSEYAFCCILSQIEKIDATVWEPGSFEIIQRLLRELNRFGKFNCLFSDGENLFCYSDVNSDGSLHFIERKAPYGLVKLMDEDYAIDLAEEKSPGQAGFIVATNPLTDENWTRLPPGNLVVLRDGRAVFGSIDSPAR